MRKLQGFAASAVAAALLLGTAAPALAAVYSEEGRPLVTLYDEAGSGDFDELNGAAAEASFRHPTSIEVMPDGSILLADSANHRIRLLKDGQVSVYAGTEVSVFVGGSGLPQGAFADGKKEESFFSYPAGIDIDAEGNLIVADRDNHAIRKISADGNVTTIAGSGLIGANDGTGSEATFYAPSDVAVAADGTIYVADTLNHLIRKIGPDGSVITLNTPSDRVIEWFEGVVEETGDFADGKLEEALFNEPSGLALDAAGNLYVSDTGNQRIRYIDFEAGTVTTVAGGGELEDDALFVEGFYIDGNAEDARFYAPKGLAVNAEGGVYIADSLNHSIRYLHEGRVTTVVGQGGHGAVNGIETQAKLDLPTDVAIASDGSLYITDTYNNKVRRLEFFKLPEGWSAAEEIRVLYGSEQLDIAQPPILQVNRTFIAADSLADALGYELSKEADAVTLTNSERSVQFTAGSSEAVVRIGAEASVRSLDAEAYNGNGSIVVPLRYAAEAMGLDVEWHAETRTVILRKPQQ